MLNHTYVYLGIPNVEHKRDGPMTCLTFLSIEVHSVAFQLIGTRLSWDDRKVSHRRGLEFLLGFLNHACKIVQ